MARDQLLVADGVQTGRAQPWAPAAAQRPRMQPTGAVRLPSLPAFLSTYLPAHPLATPPASHARTASDYDLPAPAELGERLWTHLVHALEAEGHPAQLLFPPGPSAPTNSADVLALLATHGWSLAAAQKAVAAAAPARSLPLGAEYGPDRRGTPCAHIFRRGEAIYRCRDCAHDDTCVQCAPCFAASDHTGHDIIFSISQSGGGCCDCGDDEAWTHPVRCKYHSPDDSAGERAEARERDLSDLLEGLPAPILAILQQHVAALLDLILDTLEHAPASLSLPPPGFADNLASMPSLDPFDPNPALSLTSPPDPHPDPAPAPAPHPSPRTRPRSPTPSVSMSYHTPHSPTRSRSLSFDDEDDSDGDGDSDGEGETGEDVEMDLDEMGTDVDHAWVAEQLSPPALPDDMMEELEAPLLQDPYRALALIQQSFARATQPRPRVLRQIEAEAMRAPSVGFERFFSLALWNDESHDFPTVIHMVSRTMGRTQLEAKAVAERVDRHGRDILRTCTSVPELLLAALKFAQIDLGVSIRPAYDLFGEEVAFLLWQHLKDLCSAGLFLPSAVPAPMLWRTIVTNQLMQSWEHLYPISHPQMAKEYFDPHDLTKLDGLLLLENKLPKQARVQLKDLLMLCIGSKETKKQIALRFAAMYASIVETFVLRDREEDQSISTLTVQVFSVPSVATHLVAEHNFLSRTVDLLRALLKLRRGQTSLRLPPQEEPLHPTRLFPNERAYHLFYDLRYILSAEGVQRLMCSDARHLLVLADFMAEFEGIAPDARQQGQHLEYESDEWIAVFHISSHLGRTAKLLGDAYGFATSDQLLEAVRGLLHFYQSRPDMWPLDWGKYMFDWHDVSLGEERYRVPKYEVDWEPVSFHHPLHWVLAELLRHTRALPQAIFPALGWKEDEALVTLDVPLRVAVKLAQVRAGMWVRNGFALRSQAYHYRSAQMREFMYDHDLYLLQVGFLLPPDRWLMSLLDRFGVLPLLRLEARGETSGTQVAMMDECLLVLVHLLMDASLNGGWSVEDVTRYEVVHFLALGPLTFTELKDQVSRELGELASFERVLADVSQFSPPDGPRGVGQYSLRDECYQEVHPYCRHYTRNQREKAEQVLVQRFTTAHGGKTQGALSVWAARKPHIKPGSLFDQPAFHAAFLSSTFHLALVGVLKAVAALEEDVPSSLLDSLFDSLLQLVSAGTTVHRLPFVEKLVAANLAEDSALFLLCKLERNERASGVKDKVSYVLDTAAAVAQEQHDLRDRVAQIFSLAGKPVLPPQQAGEDKASQQLEARRAAARARQQAIMKKFSQKQEELLRTFDEDEAGPSNTSGEEVETEVSPDKKGKLTDEEVAIKYGSCILCQEGLTPAEPFGMLVHIQQSRTMRILPNADLEGLQLSVRTPLTLDRGAPGGKGRLRGEPTSFSTWDHDDPFRPKGAFSPAFTRPGLYTSSCGHMMHASCFSTYAQTRSASRGRRAAENTEQLEVVCPLCKALGNTLLPHPDSHRCSLEAQVEPDPRPLPDWIRKVSIDALRDESPGEAQDPSGSGTFTPWYAAEAGEVPTLASMGMEGDWEPDTDGMLERFQRVLQLQADAMKGQLARMQERTILALPGKRIYLPQDLVGYTLSMLEVASRGRATTTNVVETLNESTSYVLRGLLHTLQLRMHLTDGPQKLRQGLLKRLLPTWQTNEAVRSPLILRDPISILVEAAVIMPAELDQIISLMYYVALIQLVFGLAQPSLWPPQGGEYRSLFRRGEADINEVDLTAARQVFPDVRWTVANIIGLVGYERGNISLGVDRLEDDTLAKLLCTHTLPFLRRAALLRSAVFGPSPASSTDTGPGQEPESEYLRLMRQLNIELPSSALPARSGRQTSLVVLIDGWIKHAHGTFVTLFQPLPLQSKLGTPPHPILLLEHPGVYELVDLPSDLGTLLQEIQVRHCQRCGEVPADPGLCLLCGDVVCYQSFCCQGDDGRGECNLHREICGGVGVFYKIKTNVILLLCEDHGTFKFSPYLDSHGEVDIGLRRGRPQRIHADRYDALRSQWLLHEIPHLIARKIDAFHDSGGWTTF